jgi:hypothetical protein
LKNSFQQPTNVVQDAPPFFKSLKNEEKQKSHFLLFGLKKSMDGLFQQPVREALNKYPTQNIRHSGESRSSGTWMCR